MCLTGGRDAEGLVKDRALRVGDAAKEEEKNRGQRRWDGGPAVPLPCDRRCEHAARVPGTGVL